MDESQVSYSELLKTIKGRIRNAQARAILAVNSELIELYWDIGLILDHRQASEGWGAAVIPRLALDLRNELPEVKGFSERNLKRMLTFYRAYPDLGAIVPLPVAQLPPDSSPLKVPPTVAPIPASLLRAVPWAHHIILIEKVKDLPTRRWYMQAILEQGWTRDGLMLEIQANAHQRQGRVASNFDVRLPAPQSDLVKQTLKDPYLFDFLTLEEPFHERELETGLVQHVERFLLELGRGFAFLGRQYPLSVAGQDFYPDLLLYHVRLHCYLVVELKRGEFKPEYAGKMNFYLNIVDDQLRQPPDGPTIGLILCQVHNRVLAEYALRGIEKPIGVSAFELTRALPATLQSALPSIEQIEQELAGHGEEPKNPEDSQAGED